MNFSCYLIYSIACLLSVLTNVLLTFVISLSSQLFDLCVGSELFLFPRPLNQNLPFIHLYVEKWLQEAKMVLKSIHTMKNYTGKCTEATFREAASKLMPIGAKLVCSWMRFGLLMSLRGLCSLQLELRI